jgi:hypothetical protein
MSSGLFFSITDVLRATATNAAIRYGRNSQNRKVPRFGNIFLIQLEDLSEVFLGEASVVRDDEAWNSCALVES